MGVLYETVANVGCDMTDIQKKMACQWFEKKANDFGADVDVVVNVDGDFVMYLKGRDDRFLHVDPEESMDKLERKIRFLMENT